MELVNIYNDKHEYLGICEKDTTHVIGAWHDVFTCLIFSPIRKTVILQIKNYSHNETHENDLIEMTVSGHLKYNENICDGIREIKEEAGINVNFDELIDAGVRKRNEILYDKYLVKEFQNVFLYSSNQKIEDYNDYDREEVTALIELKIDSLIKLLNNKISYMYGFVGTNKIKIKLNYFSKTIIKNNMLLDLLLKAKSIINK